METALSQIHVWDIGDIVTQMKGMWEEGKTHSTIDNIHHHFPRTGLYVDFHVKHDVIFSVVVDCVDHLHARFVISPGSFSNTRSSDLVLSASEGNKRLLFVLLQDSIITVLVILVVISNFVHHFISIRCM
jgi:hypothetical protein